MCALLLRRNHGPLFIDVWIRNDLGLEAYEPRRWKSKTHEAQIHAPRASRAVDPERVAKVVAHAKAIVAKHDKAGKT